MELKDLLGEAYKEGMTVEEINAVLSDKTFVDPTTLPKTVDKTVFDKTASELAKVKKNLKALEQKNMTDDEKIQEELKKAQEAQNKYNKELAKLRAKEIFVEAGLTEKDYEGILDTVVTEDEELTKARAKTMIDLINSQKKQAEKAIKAQLLKNTPKPPAGGSSEDVITKEKFEKMNWRERTELKQKDPELFKELSKTENK